MTETKASLTRKALRKQFAAIDDYYATNACAHVTAYRRRQADQELTLVTIR